jgi:hypothetical protein
MIRKPLPALGQLAHKSWCLLLCRLSQEPSAHYVGPTVTAFPWPSCGSGLPAETLPSSLQTQQSGRGSCGTGGTGTLEHEGEEGEEACCDLSSGGTLVPSPVTPESLSGFSPSVTDRHDS